MDGVIRVGRLVRHLRVRRGMRQEDLACAAGVSRSTVSRLERGGAASLRLASVAAVATALGGRVRLVVQADGADGDRMLASRHAALHEDVARYLRGVGGWEVAPEVTFSVYGERGSIDIFARHAASRTLLVIELKTELVDANELLATLDRKVRLAERIARGRGWIPAVVTSWVVMAEGRTNRRRVGAHREMLRGALPADGRSVGTFLAAPSGQLRALSFWSRTAGPVRPVRRVRVPRGEPVTRSPGGRQAGSRPASCQLPSPRQVRACRADAASRVASGQVPTRRARRGGTQEQ
jgi:transcriptional regulator with XRE-family HTH domain